MNNTAPQAKNEADRFVGCLLGLAVGDAVGTTVEFRPRGSFPPVTDMIGGGPFRLPAGAWTDDTSMALCLGESLLKCGGLNARDQMERYVRWWRDGYWSSTDICFDIGATVREALVAFRQTGDPYSGPTRERSAGNGSIMRLAPVAMAYYPDFAAVIERCGVSSWTTHGATACVEACRLLGTVLYKALSGMDKDQILEPGFDDRNEQYSEPGIAAIARGEYFDKDEDEILGSGYVVPSLEAALWCFRTTGSYEEAVLQAANLGDDADTTAAICGQVAGAYYGQSGIPAGWLEKLVRRAEIGRMAEELRMLVPSELELSALRDLAGVLELVVELELDEHGEFGAEAKGVLAELFDQMWRPYWSDQAYNVAGLTQLWEHPDSWGELSLGELRKVVCAIVRGDRLAGQEEWASHFVQGRLVGVLRGVRRILAERG